MIVQIPLNRLVLCPQNVRQTPTDTLADQELKATLRAHKLIHNLVVGPESEDGTYPVKSGGRRLFALQSLAQDGELPADAEVPCRVLTAEEVEQCDELALAENEARVALHPADQIDVFRRLVARGLTAEEIGNRFGYAERTVSQRLRLADVPEPILAAYREGEVTLGAVQELASAATTERALTAFEKAMRKKGSEALRGYTVRRELDDSRIGLSTSLGGFVADEYEAAGGAVDRDLFGDSDHVYLVDRDLVEKLATEKLEAEAARLAGQGWAWVRADLEIPFTERNKYTQATPTERAEPTESEQARLDELLGGMQDAEPNSDEWWNHELARRDLEKEISERDVYPEGTGCLVYLDHNGLRVLPGQWKPGEAPKDTSGSKRAQGAGGGPLAGLARTAVDGLRYLRGHVVRAHLTHKLAKQVLTYTIARKVLAPVSYWRAPLDISNITRHHDANPEYSPLKERVDALPLEWIEADNPWAAFRALKVKEQDEIFTVAVASMLHAQLSTDSGDTNPEFEFLAGNLGIDWSKVRPTADLIWSRMPKPAALTLARKALGNTKAVKEMAKLKKGDLAYVLEEAFGETGRTKKGRQWVVPGLAPKS